LVHAHKDGDPVARKFFSNKVFDDNNYLCPDFQEIRLRGDILTKKYLYSEVRIIGCNLDVCQDEKVIDGYPIHLLMLNPYVDLVNTQFIN
jgi:hypothetical protein